jgi:hypothetical protein
MSGIPPFKSSPSGLQILAASIEREDVKKKKIKHQPRNAVVSQRAAGF